MRKHFLKTSIVVDTDQQLITGFMISKNRIHKSQHANVLLKKYHRAKRSDYYVMDRGYASEKMHCQIRDTLNARSNIPTRSWSNTTNIRGKYRKEITDNFDFARYCKRVLVETKFSQLKRRFGADHKSRSFHIQKKEISCKIILANLDRFILFGWIEVFYRALNINGSEGVFVN